MEDKVIILSIKCITLVILAVIVSASGCSMSKQMMLTRMVEHGVDPMKAHCAIYLGDTTAGSSICVLATQK